MLRNPIKIQSVFRIQMKIGSKKNEIKQKEKRNFMIAQRRFDFLQKETNTNEIKNVGNVKLRKLEGNFSLNHEILAE